MSHRRLTPGLLIALVATISGCDNKATDIGPAVATVTITPANPNMSGGATKQLSATLRDTGGKPIDGRTIAWSSSNSSIATVSSTGLVTAAPVSGSVTITATVEGKSAMTSIGILTFVQISAGSLFSCGLIADGTAYCWGDNTKGQLGDGTQDPTQSYRPTPTRVSTSLKFVTISAGNTTTCGIAQSGFAYCWGENYAGNLGNGTADGISPVPVAVIGGYRFVSIATGNTTTCAITANGEVYCWGRVQSDSGYGEVPRAQVEPLRAGAGMVSLVAGLQDQFCSIDAAGLGYCWRFVFKYPGGGITIGPIMGPVSTTLHFTTLRVGYGHACGLIASGQAYCWGRNEYGQLGDGTTNSSVTPVAVAGGLEFEDLAAGGGVFVASDSNGYVVGYSCGLTVTGKAYCWGHNVSGELGTGSQTPSALTPQQVAGGISFKGLKAGTAHTCGLATGGAAYCWGSNISGQLGDGTTASASQPAPVFGQ